MVNKYDSIYAEKYIEQELDDYWHSSIGRRCWRKVCKDTRGMSMYEFFEYFKSH